MFRLIDAPEPVLETVQAIANEHGVTVEVKVMNCWRHVYHLTESYGFHFLVWFTFGFVVPRQE